MISSQIVLDMRAGFLDVNDIIDDNINIAYSIANKYKSRCTCDSDVDDVYSVAKLGLVEAMTGIRNGRPNDDDYRKYIALIIHGRIRNWFIDNHLIRVPISAIRRNEKHVRTYSLDYVSTFDESDDENVGMAYYMNYDIATQSLVNDIINVDDFEKRLTSEQARVLELRLLGCTLQEAADLMGRPLSCVYKILGKVSEHYVSSYR